MDVIPNYAHHNGVDGGGGGVRRGQVQEMMKNRHAY